MTENEQKIKYLNIQLIATMGFICMLVISFLLTYNKILSLKNEKTLFTNEEAQNLATIQSVIVVIISLTFLYTNYNQYKISKTYHENDEKDLFLSFEASILSFIPALIGIYIIFKNSRSNFSIAETESR